MNDDIPAEVRQFINRHIECSEQVEILVLLSSAPEHFRTVEDIYTQVLTSPDSVSRRLESFCAQGLVMARKEANGRTVYQFRPARAELDTVVRQLSLLFQQRMHRVLELIYSKPSSAIQSFADAFRIRKD
ncbi:MAG: hypothetical protein HY735_34605 [Verrucomicrobia bacterium]|nr:hypothetical protein [Verrucomicrobiota bacterium]